MRGVEFTGLGADHLRGSTFRLSGSFVMRPHPDDFDHTLAAEHLIDETMMNVDPARERAGEIAYEFLKGRGRLERIGAQDFE